jgi:hypothetical protein
VTDRTQAGIVTLNVGQEAVADIAFGPRPPAFEATGAVVDEQGNPVPNIGFVCYDVSGDGSLFGSDRAEPDNRTDSSGMFRIQSLAPGRHAVLVVPDAQSRLCSDPVVFAVDSASVGGLRVQVHDGASLSGKAVIGPSDDSAGLAQLPNVALSIVGFGPLASGETAGVALSADGTFFAPALMPGKVEIQADPQSGFSVIRVEQGGVPVPQQTISVSSGQQVTGLLVVLAASSGTVQGQVIIVGGAPPPGTQIFVGSQFLSGDSPTYGPATIADARGRI